MSSETDWVQFAEGGRREMEDLCAMLARGGVIGRVAAPGECNAST